MSGNNHAANHEKKVNEEVIQIQKDIVRVGGGKKNEKGQYTVKFGVLYDDEAGQQYYEALLGTLKAAKKRGVIDFQGQMLLKGAHDNVDIVLIPEEPPA